MGGPSLGQVIDPTLPAERSPEGKARQAGVQLGRAARVVGHKIILSDLCRDLRVATEDGNDSATEIAKQTLVGFLDGIRIEG